MIQSLERAVNILRLVAESGDGIRLCDLSRACKMNRNTVFNLADTLVNERMLAKTPEGEYVIGDMIRELAEGQKHNDYLEMVERTLRELHLKYPGTYIYYSELGRSDIIGKLHFSQDNPRKAVYTEGITLNPYITVSGLIFSAFAPSESLIDLRAKNPFEYFGLNAWGSIDKFHERVEITRKNGYSETPSLVSPSDFKIGLPVWKQPGDLRGAVTFHLKGAENSDRKEVLHDVIGYIGKICNKDENL